MCLVRMKYPQLIDVTSCRKYKSRYKNDGTKIMTQQYKQLNTGIKDIQQLEPGGPDHRHNTRP